MTPVREDLVATALKDVAAVLHRGGIDYVAIGGIAGALAGIDKPVRDIDIFIREDDADAVREGLAEVGFAHEESGESWLDKATRDGIVVDLINRIDQRIRLTDEMLGRAGLEEVLGTEIRVVGPEDLVISLAVTDKPDTHYWKDALAVLEHREIDWDYFVRRAEDGPLRMLALLLHATTYGIDVPSWVLSSLVRKCPELQAHDDKGYLAARAKEALVQDERVSEPSLEVTYDDGRITVRGTVPTEERRRAVDAVLGERFPDVDVDNHTEVAGAQKPVGTEAI